jgi:hypothetical protein
MSRVIRPESAARDRQRLIRYMAWALLGLEAVPPAAPERRDRLAFLCLSLATLADSVDQTASAWEKRGYWLKADRFRAEWTWMVPAQAGLEAALRSSEFDAVASAIAILSARLSGVEIPSRQRSPTPWTGAWARWANGIGMGDAAAPDA